MKPKRYKSSRAFSLAEVMCASFILTLLAVSSTAVFVQNQKAGVTLRWRLHAKNASLNMLEQLRSQPYESLKTLHDNATAGSTILTEIQDPTYTRPTPDPYPDLPNGSRPVLLKLNVVDGKEIEDDWTHIDLPIESSATASKLRTRFWFTVRENRSSSTPIVEALEVALMYQWQNPGADSGQWQSGTIRLLVPKTQAL